MLAPRLGSATRPLQCRRADAPRERSALESTGEVDLSSSDDEGMEVEDDARKHIATAGSATDRNPEGPESSRTAMRSPEMKREMFLRIA